MSSYIRILKTSDTYDTGCVCTSSTPTKTTITDHAPSVNDVATLAPFDEAAESRVEYLFQSDDEATHSPWQDAPLEGNINTSTKYRFARCAFLFQCKVMPLIVVR